MNYKEMKMSEFLAGKSWKTSVSGLAAILVAVGAALTALSDGKPETSVDFPSLFAACIAGVGLLFARDNNRTSESVGAK